MNYNEIQEMIDNAVYESELKIQDEINTVDQRVDDLKIDVDDLRDLVES